MTMSKNKRNSALISLAYFNETSLRNLMSCTPAFSHAGHALLESLKQLSPSPPLPLSAPRAAGVPSPPLSAPQAAGVTAMPDVLPVITPLDDTAAPELDVAPAPDAAPALHATPTAVDTLAAQ